jgi:RNA ligase (TIGR02306 family)
MVVGKEKEKQMTERKLATIRKISEVRSIPDADKICAYGVDGWFVVDSVDKYSVGDLVVFLEVDSWVPTTLAPFLSKGKEPREFEGVKGERLRTVKLRGQISQGLLLPFNASLAILLGAGPGARFADYEGSDVTEHLGIIKWERPMNAQLAGMARGNFPALVPKTDQERIQNLTRSFEQYQQDIWSVTEKLDGSSCTFYLDDEDVFHVCSRNLDLKEDEANSFWKVARKFNIEDVMRRNSMLGMAIQGEMIGEGIQGNQYKVQLDFYVYDMYNVHTGQYILPMQLKAACEKLGLKHVPILSEIAEISSATIQSLLQYAEGKSLLNGSNREGVVFKSNTVHDRSFKIVSNSWLIKNE